MAIASAAGSTARERANPHVCSPPPAERGASASPGIDSGRRGRRCGRGRRPGPPRRSPRWSRTGPAHPAPARAARPPSRPRRAPPARSRRGAAGCRCARAPRTARRCAKSSSASSGQRGAAARGCCRARSAARRACAAAAARTARRRARCRTPRPRRSSPARTSAASTRDVASSPRERPSSDRLISVFGGSASASPVTNEPRPRGSTRPSATSSSIARRTVARLTPSSSHSQRSDGSRSPGLQRAALDLVRDLPVDPVVERLGRLADRHCPRDYSSAVVRHVKPFGPFWFVMVRSGPCAYLETGLWADVRGLPGALARHDRRRGRGRGGGRRCCARRRRADRGHRQRRRLLRRARAVAGVAGGRGRPADRRASRAVSPCARASAGAPGDAVLAVSSSGEFRDVVEIAARRGRAPVRGDHGRAPARRWPAAADASCSSTSRPSAPSRTRRRLRAPTRAGSRSGPR